MPSTKELLIEQVNRLSEEDARELLDLVKSRPKKPLTRQELIKRATGLPGIRVPDPDAPPFEKFEPIKTRGIPASELLIRDRR
jgi:hypothetical protein